MIQYDYSVIYEGDCEPYTETCFVYCEDDDCIDPLYYTWIERHAATLKEVCGDLSITDCEESLNCLPNEVNCSISYCDPGTDEDCEYLTEQDSSANSDSL